MKLLVGECTGRLVPQIQERGWGRMFVTRRVTPYPGEPWGFDNGAFSAWKRGEEFPRDKYMERLAAAQLVGTPLLAIVPDKVAAPDSLQFSARWLFSFGNRRWPWYLALQDGMKAKDVMHYAGSISGLFLGGTDRFKRDAAWWARLAREWGLGFHYGRASTFQRLEHAIEIGSTSADTTTFMWTKTKWKRLLDWWDDSRVNQYQLPEEAA